MRNNKTYLLKVCVIQLSLNCINEGLRKFAEVSAESNGSKPKPFIPNNHSLDKGIRLDSLLYTGMFLDFFHTLSHNHDCSLDFPTHN